MPNIILSAGESLTEQKRSRFIGYCAPVESEEAARAVIDGIRARYRDASHHVFAYGLDNAAYARYSDDGEPQGTAGLPVLNIFLKREVIRFVCVVTRYFGGTLLGAGGLARAYSGAAKEALAAAGTAPFIRRTVYNVTVPYAAWDKFKYEIKKHGLAIDRAAFTDICEAAVTVPETHEEVFKQMTAGFTVKPEK